jgi:2-amino-4-hydroxy-6-hydroxymethyldihydropteridine diphosphokinase
VRRLALTEWTAIGLGGNLGAEPVLAARLADARAALEAMAGVDGRLSSLYRSAPLGPVADQPAFLNAVLILPWQPPTPIAMLEALQFIEALHGRVRDVAGGPRTLDLDILLIGRQRIVSPALVVPHPRLAERRFVLAPLAELCGDDFALPDGRTLGELLADPAVQAQALTRLD